MRGRREEQEVPGQASEELRQAVTLGVFDLAPEVGGAELVGFVADDQVPIGLLQLGLDVLVATGESSR